MFESFTFVPALLKSRHLMTLLFNSFITRRQHTPRCWLPWQHTTMCWLPWQQSGTDQNIYEQEVPIVKVCQYSSMLSYCNYTMNALHIDEFPGMQTCLGLKGHVVHAYRHDVADKSNNIQIINQRITTAWLCLNDLVTFNHFAKFINPKIFDCNNQGTLCTARVSVSSFFSNHHTKK